MSWINYLFSGGSIEVTLALPLFLSLVLSSNLYNNDDTESCQTAGRSGHSFRLWPCEHWPFSKKCLPGVSQYRALAYLILYLGKRCRIRVSYRFNTSHAWAFTTELLYLVRTYDAAVVAVPLISWASFFFFSFSSHLFSSPFFILSPSRNSDPGPHFRLCSPPHHGSSLAFSARGDSLVGASNCAYPRFFVSPNPQNTSKYIIKPLPNPTQNNPVKNFHYAPTTAIYFTYVHERQLTRHRLVYCRRFQQLRSWSFLYFCN